MMEIRDGLFGAVVVKLGLCTAADVEEALALQEKCRGNRQKAPKLGEALASLGKLSAEQVQAVLSGTLTGKPGRRFGEVLVEMHMVGKDAVVEALKKQKQEDKQGKHRPLGSILLEAGAIRDEHIPTVLSAQGLSPLYCVRCNVIYNVPDGMRKEYYICQDCRQPLAEYPARRPAEPKVKHVESLAHDLPPVAPAAVPVGKPMPEEKPKERAEEQALEEEAPPALAEAPAISETYGPFKMLEVIGEDAHSVLYRAQDTRSGTVVALRVFPDPLLNTPEQRQTMQEAFKRLARVNHPGLKRVLEVGEREGVNYIVEEFVVGKSLRAFQDESDRIHLRVATSIILQVAEVLEAAHLAGIHHLGLRPSLIIIQPTGKAKVGGFGYPKDAISDMRRMAERTGEVSVYAAPELAVEGLPRDHRADIYSLGSVYYQLVTGHPPFRGDSVGELLLRISGEEVPPPANFRADLPARVNDLLIRMLAIEPAARPANMREVIRALHDVENLESGMEPVSLTFPAEQAHPEGIAPRRRRSSRMRGVSTRTTRTSRARTSRAAPPSRRAGAPARRGGASPLTKGLILLGFLLAVLAAGAAAVWWLSSAK